MQSDPLYMICVLLLVLGSMFSEGIDPGSSLRPGQGQVWLSSANNISMGFHPSKNNGLYVVGITFASINDTTPVWTVGYNGGIEVGQDGSFNFQTDGNLVLSNGTQVLWETGTGNRSVVSAEMQDDGNFVLKNSSTAVWESFQNPTDTLVVGQNFAVGQKLQSDPYTFTLGSNGNFTLLWRNNITYLNEGAPGATSASLTSQGIFKLSNASSDSMWTARSSDYTDNSITLRRIRLESDGNLRSYGWVRGSGTWQLGWRAVEDQCQVYGWCGNSGVCVYNETGPFCQCPSADFVQIDPTDPTGGCRREQDLTGCSNNQSMVDLDHTQFFSYPPESESKTEIFSLGIRDCRENCLKNPSCTASTILSDGSGTCRMKTSNFTSAYQSLSIPSTSYVKVCGSGKPLPPPDSPVRTVTKSKVPAIGVAIAVIVPLIALITLQLCIWWFYCRHNPKFRFGELPSHDTLLEYASGAPVQFSYSDLQRCTKNFAEKVGYGGFGTVYKGELSNKTIVAVKRLEGIEQGEKQFRMEVATISSTHHLNLVRLVGFCSEGRHRLLVYEFMKNSSLDKFLFNSSEALDWDTRFSIAVGTAKGIAYLHEECRDCIVHCDIKPENILLDENFNAKVSDFGLSKLIHTKVHQNASLTSVRGTRGYLAPEWLANLPITSKSDVFSYGMVLLETVSGRRNFDIMPAGRKKFSVWAFEEFERGDFLNIVDPRLVGDVNMEQVQRTLEISFWCIQEQPSQRPSMGKVVQMLGGLLHIEKPPAPKPLNSIEKTSSGSGSHSQSAISMLAASVPPASSTSSLHGIISSNSSSKYRAEILSDGR